jgi:hypothetical protein
MAVGDWARDNKTINQVTDPLGVVDMMGQGGTWFDPMNFFGMGQGLPNPADAAMGYFDQVPGTIKPYYDPYIQAGQKSLGSLMGQYNNLINDPGSVMSSLGKGFKEDPGYQYMQREGQNSAMNAAAAGGYAGTAQHQKNAANISSNLANQGYQNYLGNALGLYGKGLSGQEGINQMGYNASDSLASSLAANLMNQGQLAYKGAESQNNAKGGIAKNLLGVAGSVFGF